MKLLLFFLILFIIFGCASEPLTPEEQHAREDALIVEWEQFWLAYDECLKYGTVVFEGHHIIPIRKRLGEQRPRIDKWTMRSATCAPRQ